jgi:hypothetical protein
MKANELRIGNLVYLKSKDAIYEISSGHDIEEIDDAPINFDAKPISLTEEWLLKFGFKDVDLNMSGSNWLVKEQKGLWRQAIRIAYSEKSEEWSLTLECVSPPTLSIVRLKYVHQLQNLYFALTGEELTIKSE